MYVISLIIMIFGMSCVSGETKKEIETLKSQREILLNQARSPGNDINSTRLQGQLEEIDDALLKAKKKGALARARAWKSAGGIAGMATNVLKIIDGVPGIGLALIALRALSEGLIQTGKKIEGRASI